jgi:hypothetical protein
MPIRSPSVGTGYSALQFLAWDSDARGACIGGVADARFAAWTLDHVPAGGALGVRSP